jgi:hypothetical protein
MNIGSEGAAQPSAFQSALDSVLNLASGQDAKGASSNAAEPQAQGDGSGTPASGDSGKSAVASADVTPLQPVQAKATAKGGRPVHAVASRSASRGLDISGKQTQPSAAKPQTAGASAQTLPLEYETVAAAIPASRSAAGNQANPAQPTAPAANAQILPPENQIDTAVSSASGSAAGNQANPAQPPAPAANAQILPPENQVDTAVSSASSSTAGSQANPAQPPAPAANAQILPPENQIDTAVSSASSSTAGSQASPPAPAAAGGEQGTAAGIVAPGAPLPATVIGNPGLNQDENDGPTSTSSGVTNQLVPSLAVNAGGTANLIGAASSQELPAAATAASTGADQHIPAQVLRVTGSLPGDRAHATGVTTVRPEPENQTTAATVASGSLTAVAAKPHEEPAGSGAVTAVAPQHAVSYASPAGGSGPQSLSEVSPPASASAGSAAAAVTDKGPQASGSSAPQQSGTTAASNAPAGTPVAAAAGLGAGNDPQTASGGSNNGGPQPDSQGTAGMQSADLAGASIISPAAGSVGQTAAEGQDQTPSSSTTASLGAAETPRTPSPAEAEPVITPRVLAGVHESEMRVEVRSEGMGQIEIHAVLHGDQIGAAISAQQTDTRQWMVSHISELTQALSSHDLRVSNLSISEPQAGASLQSGFGQSEGQGQGNPRNQAAFRNEASEPEAETEIEDPLTGETYTRTGLDLRA